MSGTTKQQLLDELASVMFQLGAASGCLRQQLDQLDPEAHPSQWRALNNQIRALDEQCAELRGQQQRVAATAVELRPLSAGELAALRGLVSEVAALVKKSSTAGIIAQATSAALVGARQTIAKSLG